MDHPNFTTGPISRYGWTYNRTINLIWQLPHPDLSRIILDTPFYHDRQFFNMIITEEEAGELKTWVVKKLEDM